MKNNTFVRILSLVLLFCYAIFVFWQISYRGLFEYVGIDYKLRYSTAKIVREFGFNSIYDYDLQTYFQKPIFDEYSKKTPDSMDYWTIPLPYLPIYTILFLPYSLLPPHVGFSVWVILTFFISIVYIYSFLKRMNFVEYYEVGFILLLSLPFFLNILFGQVNLWLMISIGEFYISFKNNKYFKSGLWLTGLLLKPQTLILFVPWLLITKKWSVIKGFFIGTLAVLSMSYLFIGSNGVIDLLNVFFEWPVLASDSGMNFLSMNQRLQIIFPTYLTVIILGFFTFITLLALFKLWALNDKKGHLINLDLILVGTMAATFSVSPHSNIHMAILLIPLLIVLLARNIVPKWVAYVWIFLPSGVFLIFSIFSVGMAHAITGRAQLGVNLFLLLFAINSIIKMGYKSVGKIL